MRIALALLLGCSFAPSGQTGESRMDGSASPGSDASMVGGEAGGPTTCLDAWKAHTIQIDAPAALTEINTSNDDRDPFLTPDGMTIYYSQDNGIITVDMDIMFATRAAPTGPFTVPANNFAGNIDTSANQGKIAVSADGQSAIYASDDSGAGGVDLFDVQRDPSSHDFDTRDQSLVTNLDTNKDQSDPWWSVDTLRLYYANIASNHQAIVMASRADTGSAFGNVTSIIDSGSGDADPSLSPDELVMVFSSNRSGKGDLYYATRTSTSEAFGTPVMVPTVNTSDSDGDPFLTADGCTLYFASNHTTGNDYDLFVATAHP